MQMLLIQLPVPQLNFGRRTGNIPLAAACLQQAWGSGGTQVLPQASATYLGDGALLEHICTASPTAVGFTTYAWNLDRTLYLARRLKERQGIRVLLGGPEITPDNPRLSGAAADHLISGEGEGLLSDGRLMSVGHRQWRSVGPYAGFSRAPSPYLAGLLDPAIDDMVLLETQRGCPHRCGYCFYGKGRRRVHRAEMTHLLAAARWTHERSVSELYLLDPALDARPDLDDLLARLAAINADRAMVLHSELRAEAVDAALARRLAAAGFKSLEIGLQSIHPAVLEKAGRHCDLTRFLAGTEHLRQRGIACIVDLIIGLPGDTLAGFRASVDLVADAGLADHLQVFPLAVLPGTRFRQAHTRLGLHFDPAPPYLLTHTETFSRAEIGAALDYAEERCGLALYPRPHLDIAWRHPRGGDLTVHLDGEAYIRKLMLTPETDPSALAAKALRLTHPYQVFVDERAPDQTRVEAAIGVLTAANPFTPLELVLLSPRFRVDVEGLLRAAALVRPNYLDKDLQFADEQTASAASPTGGGLWANRSFQVTLVTGHGGQRIEGPMCRRVLWWPAGRLPAPDQLTGSALSRWDGVLVGAGMNPAAVDTWQRARMPSADDLPAISFEVVDQQRLWLSRIAPGDYTGAF